MAETPTNLVAENETSSVETTPTVRVTITSDATNTLIPATPSAPPSLTPSLTPNVVDEGPLLTFTAWENNSSFVYGMTVGCFEAATPCFGEMKLLFELQNIEIRATYWSPDGEWLAFEGKHESNSEIFRDIFIIDANGQNLINLTNVKDIVSNNEFRTIAQTPRWSPNGQTLAYNLCNLICPVFATNIATGETVKLLEKLSLTEEYRNTDTPLGGWSPTGEQIAIFIDDLDSNSQVYTSNLDGSELLQITDTLEENYQVSYSPDGQWLLVNRASSPEDTSYFSSLFLVRPDGSEEIQLTISEVSYYDPIWSLDSQWLAVVGSTEIDTEQIMLINLEGVSLSLELEPGKYSNPGWRPVQKP